MSAPHRCREFAAGRSVMVWHASACRGSFDAGRVVSAPKTPTITQEQGVTVVSLGAGLRESERLGTRSAQRDAAEDGRRGRPARCSCSTCPTCGSSARDLSKRCFAPGACSMRRPGGRHVPLRIDRLLPRGRGDYAPRPAVAGVRLAGRSRAIRPRRMTCGSIAFGRAGAPGDDDSLVARPHAFDLVSSESLVGQGKALEQVRNRTRRERGRRCEMPLRRLRYRSA